MALRADYKTIIDNAVKAIKERTFFAQYPEHPKAYGEGANEKGIEAYKNSLNKVYDGLHQKDAKTQIGEEDSPYTQEALGVTYPSFDVADLVARANNAFEDWRNTSADDRADILIDSLERTKERFFEIAYATMHTTGQSFIMSFQASGPHAADRALEALALGYDEITRFPENITWDKPMGKFNLVLNKSFKAVPKGIGVVIGCSTFPTWNSVPGVYASLITGNPVIVKPHPKAILPMAIYVEEIQNALNAAGINPEVIQLAADSSDKLITKELAEHADVNLIDYTGGSTFGDYIESLQPAKTVFTEKAGVNSVILDSSRDLAKTMQNIAFAASLYSGQMCTAPQNIFVPESGVKSGEDHIAYADVVNHLKEAVNGLVNHPKMGAGTLGAIQNPATMQRAQNAGNIGSAVLETTAIENPEFSNARVCTPTIREVSAGDNSYEKELFGPILLVIKTKDTNESIELARNMAENHGAITCSAYTTDEGTAAKIEMEMERVFTPVSFNFEGAAFVNQHASFSDFHVTGGNPAGNASFTNPEYVNKRFVWVGHRKYNA